MANRYMVRCSTLLVTRKMQIITTSRYNLTPVRIAILKKTRITSTGKDVKKGENLCSVGGTVNWGRHRGKT